MDINKDNKTLIKTVNLIKSFKIGKETEVQILKGIDVTIEKGDFVIIFGPSGCGKSTLLHTLIGLEAPTSGSLLVDGNDFYNQSEDKRAIFRRHHVGIIYQQPLWISSLNVVQNVEFTLNLLNYNSDLIKEKATTALTTVGMNDWMSYKPTELSSGQQQKISLARAISIEPVMLVADEPTGNLDTVSGQELIQNFLKLNKQGVTILMVTHDLEYLKYGNKLIHMIDGKVVEEFKGKPGQSFNIKVQGKKEDLQGTSDAGFNVRDTEFLKKLQKT